MASDPKEPERNAEPEAQSDKQQQQQQGEQQLQHQSIDVGHIDGPSSIGPPSPLTGCYMLIILGEPHSSEHKDIILQRLLKGNFAMKTIFQFERKEKKKKKEQKLRHSFDSTYTQNGEIVLKAIQYQVEMEIFRFI